jgi:hypothetical protein
MCPPPGLGHDRRMTNTAVRPVSSTSTAAPVPAPTVPAVPAGTVPAAVHVPGTATRPLPEAASGATPTRARLAEVSAAVASVLGLGSAVVSLGWGLGNTLLLDTVGGVAERAALERTPLALAGIVSVVALKVVAALLPGWSLSPDGSAVYPSARRRVVRALGWVAAVVLTGYGAVMTVGGILVTSGVIDAAPGADTRAIAWHAFLWDPWFLLWGLAATVALLASRRPEHD